MTSFKNTKKDETFKDLKAKNMKEFIDRNQDNYAFFCQMALTIITTSIFQIKDKNSQASLTSTSTFLVSGSLQ